MAPKFIRKVTRRVAAALRKRTGRNRAALALPLPPSPSKTSPTASAASSSASAPPSLSARPDAPCVPPPPGRRVAPKKTDEALPPSLSDAEDVSTSSVSSSSSKSDPAAAPHAPPPIYRADSKMEAEESSRRLSHARDFSLSAVSSSACATNSSDAARVARAIGSAEAKNSQGPSRATSATEHKVNALVATADVLILEGYSIASPEGGSSAGLADGESSQLLALQYLHDAAVLLERAEKTLGTHESARATYVRAQRVVVGVLIRGLESELEERISVTTRSPASAVELVLVLLARAHRRAAAGHKHCQRRGRGRTSRRRLRSAAACFAEAYAMGKTALAACRDDDVALRELVCAALYGFDAWYKGMESLEKDREVFMVRLFGWAVPVSF